MAPGLADMPVEILDAIIDWLPQNDYQIKHNTHLMSLRQVCSSIEIKSRPRFGRDCLFEINVSVNPREVLWDTAIPADEVLRICARQLNIYIGSPYEHLGDDSGWGSGISYLACGNLQHVFEEILATMPRVKDIIIYNPVLSDETANETQKKIECHWHATVSATLSAIQAGHPSYLSNLQIGHNHLFGLPVPSHVLQGLAKDSTAFTGLHKLVLHNLVKHELSGSAPFPADTSVTDCLSQFVALVPNLRSLCYTAGSYVRSADSSELELSRDDLLLHMAPLPVLGFLDVNGIYLKQSDMIDGILQFRSTLRRLSLFNVTLTSVGSWRPVFQEFGRDLALEYFYMRFLRQGDLLVMHFDELHQQRPVALDRSSYDTSYSTRSYLQSIASQYMAFRTFSMGLEREVTGKEAMEEFLEDDWVWVDRKDGAQAREVGLELDAGDGDDIKMWLVMVADRHRLRPRRW